MLPDAAAAVAEDFAARRDPRRPRLQQLEQLAASETPTFIDDSNAQAIAGRGEGNEERPTVRQSADAVATCREAIDLHDRLRGLGPITARRAASTSYGCSPAP